MKILMVTSFYPPFHVGGACTHVYYLANELARRGHEIHVVFSKDAYRLKRKKNPELTYENHRNVILHPIETPAGRLTPLTTYVSGIIPYERMLRNIFKKDYDVIHFHNVSLFGPRIFAMGRGRKFYTAHDHWLVCPLNDMFNHKGICERPGIMKCQACLISSKRPPQAWRAYQSRNLMHIEKIISPSSYLKSFLTTHGINRPFALMPNFVPEPPKTDAVPGDYFFFAGMLERRKGVLDLIKVFKQSGKNLIIAGTGSLRPVVEKQSTGNIKYAGFLSQTDMYRYYKGAKALILPSLCPENSPNTIIEAMSVGTPSIGSNVGGIPEMLGLLDMNLVYKNNSELKSIINRFRAYDRKKVKQVFEKHFNVRIYVKNYLRLLSSDSPISMQIQSSPLKKIQEPMKAHA